MAVSKELRKQVFVTVFVLNANCNWQDQGNFWWLLPML
jgi:hypothetical protein